MGTRSTYALTVCFGMSSWVTINGTFAILPLLIQSGQVPEGWAIASTLGLAIQAGNIGPLLYRGLRPGFKSLPAIVYSILAIGALSMCLLALFWDVTMDIMGMRCSVMLILLAFTAALCDCTSSVVFWPFIGSFAPAMVSALALGENLSGVAASAASWLGVWFELPPSGSFCMLAVVLLVSGLAFRKLQKLAPALEDTQSADIGESFISDDAQNPTCPFVVVGLMSLLENAVLPGILPYATARYSSRDYHIASTLPVSSLGLLTLAYCQASRAVVLVMSSILFVVIGLITMVAIGSLDFGSVMTITLVMVAKALVAYCKATSMYHLKIGACQPGVAQKHLETAGGLMQVFSVVGAMAMFVVVHFTGLFHRGP